MEFFLAFLMAFHPLLTAGGAAGSAGLVLCMACFTGDLVAAVLMKLPIGQSEDGSLAFCLLATV